MLRYYWLSICNTRFRPKTTKAVMNLCKKICVAFSARMNITSVHRTVQTHEFKVNGEWDIYRTRAQWKVSFIYHPCLIYGFLSKRFVAQCVKCNIRVDILSVTRHVVSRYVNSYISTQHRVSVLFLLELLFVREGVHCFQLSFIVGRRY